MVSDLPKVTLHGRAQAHPGLSDANALIFIPLIHLALKHEVEDLGTFSSHLIKE